MTQKNRMYNLLWLPLLLVLFLASSSAERPTRKTDQVGANQPVPEEQSNRPNVLPGVVIESWRYDPSQKTVTLHLLNRSHKDVTAFNISIAEKYADGSTNPNYAEGIRHSLQDSQIMEDMLGSMINGGPDKAFAAGTAYDYVLRGKEKEIADIEAVVDVVVYVDASADVLNNERAFRNLLAARKGSVLAMERVNEVLKQVLADPSISDPLSAALNELRPFAESLEAKTKRGSPEEAEFNEAMSLRIEIRNLEYIQEYILRERLSESNQRERLAQNVQDQEKRIALLAPHANLSVNLADVR